VIIVDGHKFRQSFYKEKWGYQLNQCAAKINTDDACSAVLGGNLEHVHSKHILHFILYQMIPEVFEMYWRKRSINEMSCNVI
jgi:hypothetical protein